MHVADNHFDGGERPCNDIRRRMERALGAHRNGSKPHVICVSTAYGAGDDAQACAKQTNRGERVMPIIECDQKDCKYQEEGYCEAKWLEIASQECMTYRYEGGYENREEE